MKTGIVLMTLLVVPLVLVLASYAGLHAGPPSKGAASKRGRTVADTFTSVKKREAMGVDPPTWIQEHGKIQPDVHIALEQEKELEKNMDKDLIAAMYKPGRPVGFLSTVYVAVHLQVEQRKHKEETRAAIQRVQSRVLRKLTAAEFAVSLCFKDHAAVLGYANEAGLAKLAEDKDVIAIGLDDKPFPREPTRFYSQGGEKVDGRLVKVSSQIRAALEKVDYVEVIVILKRDEIQGPKLRDKTRQARKVQDRVLSRLSAQDFRLTLRMPRGGLHGYVDSAGLTELAEDPDVVGVGLPGPPAQLQGYQGRRP